MTLFCVGHNVKLNTRFSINEELKNFKRSQEVSW